MPEDIASISSSRMSAAEVSRHSFGTVRRGFDPQEVRSYLELVARELAAWEQHEQELRRQLADALERSRHPVIDESTLSAALGQQSAQVLRSAHEEAARIALEADQTGAALVREAQSQAAELRVQAESGAAERIAEAEIAAGALHQQAEEAAARLIEASRADGEALIERVRGQGQAMLDQAQETRRRMLADLAQRRRAMTIQIEQFRAARDELASSVSGVRDSVDRIVADLARADDEARAAAADVARRQPAEATAEELAGEVERAEAALDSEPGAPAGRVDHTLVVVDVEAVDNGAVVEEVEVVGVVAEPGDESDVVEGLFARLRAGQPEGAVRQPVPDRPPVGAAAPAEGEGDAGPAADGDDPEPSPDDRVRAQGAEMLVPVVARLAKRVKRALQDDQNRLLDRLRSGSGEWSEDVLVPEDEQRALYVDAAAPSLRDAAAAGIAFARAQRGRGRGKDPLPDDNEVADAAEGLAATVVALLRRRLIDQDPDGADAADRIGAAYREWRGERIERLVGDSALGAFSSGVLAASGHAVRWVVGASGSPCADCDDNALGGTVAPGEEFPTGHRHPPAHAGCRCLVVPTPA